MVEAAEPKESITYEGGRFRLRIANIEEGGTTWDKLQQSVVLGSGADGIAVGTWSRVRWVSNKIVPGASAEVVLAGMPQVLKGRIETELGESIQLRWRWKGLARSQTHRSKPIMGIIMTNTWLTPDPIALDFLEGGAVVWKFQ